MRIRKNYQAAIDCHQSNDFDGAISAYLAVLKLSPEHSLATHGLGLIEFGQDNHEKGIEWLRRSTELEPGNADFLVNLGSALIACGRYQTARATLQKAVNLIPEHAIVHFNLVRVNCKLEQYADAELHQRKLMRLEPDDVSHLIELGSILMSSGDAKAALVELQRATRRCRNDRVQLNQIGVTLMRGNFLVEAEGLFADLVAKFPTDFQGYLNLGVLSHKRDEPQQAIAHLRKSLELEPTNAEAWYNLGFVYHLTGAFSSAIEALQKSRGFSPDSSRTLELLVRAMIENSDREPAIELLSHWRKRDPADPIATHLFASITGDQSATRASNEYVTSTFDQFSDSYDTILAKIRYQGPKLICDALESVFGKPNASLGVLDAGCGTGLCGEIIRPFAKVLDGVDLSTGMLRQAQQLGLYDQLHACELVAYMENHIEKYDLVISGDTFNYFGDLRPLFGAVFGVLAPRGVVVFTLELHADNNEEFHLNPHGRFSHSHAYFTKQLVENGFEISKIEKCVLRFEANQPVSGLLVVAMKNQP